MGKRIKLPPGSLGMFEKLGVRLAFRKAKLVSTSTDAGAAVLRRQRGASSLWPGRRHSQEVGWAKAALKRDAKMKEVRRGRARIEELKHKGKLTKAERQERGTLSEQYGTSRVTVTGATDPETGVSGAGLNGANPSFQGDKPWKCAERAAFEDVNRQRVELGYPRTTPDKLDYSRALELDTGLPKGIDGRCQERIPPWRFPDGTEFYVQTGDQRGWTQTRGEWDGPTAG